MTSSDSIVLGQWIRRNNEATPKELTPKLLHGPALNVSQWTVQRQRKRMSYKSTLSYNTPMVTQEQKHARVQWAIQHKDDDWSRTIFTDETCHQLFCNTIRRRSRNPSTEVKRISKNKEEIIVCGSISIKGLIGYCSFETIMVGTYYVQDHLIPNTRRQFGRCCRLKQDNDPKHRSQLAQQFLSSKVAEVIDCSSNSPNANPVENL